MSKYNAIKTEVDGYIFASKREANRYSELKLLEMAGEISNLELQPEFPVVINDKNICTYIADFKYTTKVKKVVIAPDPNQWNRDMEIGSYIADMEIVEDVKGVKTPVYRLKKKLVQALYGIAITEIY